VEQAIGWGVLGEHLLKTDAKKSKNEKKRTKKLAAGSLHYPQSLQAEKKKTAQKGEGQAPNQVIKSKKRRGRRGYLDRSRKKKKNGKKPETEFSENRQKGGRGKESHQKKLNTIGPGSQKREGKR